jgi:hypothetical protein
MADAYVSAVYTSAALAKAGINAVAADKLVSVCTYQEGSKWMFLVISKA